MTDLIPRGQLVAYRERAIELGAHIRALPQVVFETSHHFSHGVYTRALYLPKNAVAEGHIHRFASLNIIAKGEVSVLTEEGVIRYPAGSVFVGRPGSKRITYAHEDTVWINPFPTDKINVEDIIDEFTVGSFEEIDALLQLGGS